MQSKKTVLFYSSVKDKRSFYFSRFYRDDINMLRENGLTVKLSNSVFPFLHPWKYDYAFLYFFRKSLLPAIISRVFGKKVVIIDGIDDLALSSGLRWQLARLAFVGCVRFSTVSNIVSYSDYKMASRILGNSTSLLQKLQYCPYAASSDIRPLTKSEYDRLKKDWIVTICWMGTVENVKRKGVDVCLLVLREILQRCPEYKLIIIGQIGLGTEYLRNLVSEMHLEAHVEFTGGISEENKNNFLKQARFYFQLSQYEGFGLAVLEAAQNFCMIFHTNRGGLADTIGNRGYIVENVKDIQSIAEQFQQLHNGADSEFDSLQKNYASIIDQFSPESRKKFFGRSIEGQ